MVCLTLLGKMEKILNTKESEKKTVSNAIGIIARNVLYSLDDETSIDLETTADSETTKIKTRILTIEQARKIVNDEVDPLKLKFNNELKIIENYIKTNTETYNTLNFLKKWNYRLLDIMVIVQEYLDILNNEFVAINKNKEIINSEIEKINIVINNITNIPEILLLDLKNNVNKYYTDTVSIRENIDSLNYDSIINKKMELYSEIYY